MSNTITFRQLTIERIRFGENKGKIVATLSVEGKQMDTTIRLSESVSISLLRFCAGEVAAAASEEAQAFQNEFLTAINASIQKL